ncbi:MAG: bifunctional molybdenum cofactor guanylyltransferase MobA/molybdopterin-guanine dinucleotide biosynthesis adaptor protein MobB [Bdellovibrionales bacterium]|nr:bifunctional molybdenum cofactor guanylyltransferase MobA/molybdopterin-guanine dinucleotide biosynthesis adaptor protein MobB [Bdellovibrionales bacterium]
MYHAYELAFVGFSNSGKTTLISKLIRHFSCSKKIGYLKAHAHTFEMDKPGKDTHIMTENGAVAVSISSMKKSAWIQQEPERFHQQRQKFLDCDWVFVEGEKGGKIPKVVVLDPEMKIMSLIERGEITDVFAYVGESRQSPLENHLLYFHRDDIEKLSSFVDSFFKVQAQKTPLYGLVLTGGQSSRMGQDKALMNYHGVQQAEYLYKLLEVAMEKTFLSSRKDQWQGESLENLPQIFDQLLGFGPMGGMLSAMTAYPEAAWFVVACDLPVVDQTLIKDILDQRDPYKIATAYRSQYCDFPEPLFAIYEPKSSQRLFEYMGLGYRCPRKVLINSEVKLIDQPFLSALDNANDPEESQRIQTLIQGGDLYGK